MSDLLNQASLVMVPSGYKEDTVYSVVPSDGSGDLAFTRASNGTRINSAGLVEVCPWNLATDSENFSALYSGINASISNNTTSAPNATTTADSLLETTATDIHAIFADYTQQSGVQYTYSVYVKSISGRNVRVSGSSGFTGPIALVDLSNGSLLSGSTGASVESVGNGWYRISLTATTTTTTVRVIIYSMNGTATTFAGSTSNGVYLWGAQLNTGALKPYFPTTDRLNVPRLTYQNGGGGCPSLLLEKQSTNLVTYSEQLDNAAYIKTDVAITANNTTSPDGTQNADLFTTNNAAGTVYRVYSTSIGGTDTTNTISAFFKYGNHPYVFLVGDSAGSGKFGIFNIQNGTIENTSAGYTATITNYGNGWYRCTLTGTMDSTNNIQFGLTASTSSYAGTSLANGKTMYCWGAMREYNTSYPTSYIPTTSSSATRVADACFKTGISSLIGQTEGVLFVDFDLKSTANTTTYDSIINIATDANNSIDIVKFNTTNELYVFAINGGVIQVNSTGISGTNIQGKHKMALAYKLNDYVCYLDGVQVFTDTSATVPACSNLYLGAYLSSANQLGGAISQAALFKTRLTNAELASLTTL